MSRKEITNTDLPAEGARTVDLKKLDEHRGAIVAADSSVIDPDYLAELAFMAEWVDIRIAPSHEQHAPKFVQSWTNGKPAEMLIDGQAREAKFGALPIGHPITVRRSTVENLVRSKITNYSVDPVQPDPDRKDRMLEATTPAHTFTVLRDPSPRGPAWLTELYRRNF